jgi:hypothetical protein
MGWAGLVDRVGEMRNSYELWLGKPRKVFEKSGRGCVDGINVAQDKLQWRYFVCMVMNLLVP